MREQSRAVRDFAIFRDFFAIFRDFRDFRDFCDFSRFLRFFARARASLALATLALARASRIAKNTGAQRLKSRKIQVCRGQNLVKYMCADAKIA